MEVADAVPAPIAAVAPGGVVHVPYTYFPEAVGGTEVYVSGLIRALRSLGVPSAIAAPAEVGAAYDHHEVSVYRFATDRRSGLFQAYGAPDDTAARSFRALVARLRPQIIHLHARSAAVSERLVDMAHEVGAKVVFTYHTPTVSCARGTMMRLGRWPCDGRLDVARCSACVLQSHGMPRPFRDLLAHVPQAVGAAVGNAGLAGGPFTALRMSALIGAEHDRFHALMEKVDRIVAACGWVADVLRLNGVPDAKLMLCRQGMVRASGPRVSSRSEASCGRSDGALRLGYFGRLDPTKGVDVLAGALRRVPDAAVHLDVYGIRQPGSEPYAAQLGRAAAADPRITLQPALQPDAVSEAMQRCDLVVVPSRWLETGPLVVLEAFAAGTPVLGARLGGIAELVSDGVDGVLVEPDDPPAWAQTIAALANEPTRVARLRAGVRPPRTMDDVGNEMAALYRSMLADGDR
jgi:glycosyltransferase involved in cell wall biosynthesis